MNISVLFNPFEKYNEKDLLGFGFLALVLGSLFAFWWNARYDGALDLHFSYGVKWWEPFVDNFINLSSISLIFYGIGKIIYKKTRFIDILALSLVARFPLYLLTLTNINGANQKYTETLLTTLPDLIFTEGLIPLLIFSLIGILLLLWMIVLFYKGFKISTNSKGWKLNVGIVIALILSEVLSKIIFNLI